MADVLTPVSIYLRMRDKYVNSILLESTDSHGSENSYSYICFDPLATFSCTNTGELQVKLPGAGTAKEQLSELPQVHLELQKFYAAFAPSADENSKSYSTNGLFGYLSYDAVQAFDSLKFDASKKLAGEIPLCCYHAYRYVLVFDHFKNQVVIYEHSTGQTTDNSLEEVVSLIQHQPFTHHPFSTTEN